MNPWVLFGLLILAVVVVWAWMALMERVSPTDTTNDTDLGRPPWWVYDDTTGKWHLERDD